MKNFVKIGNKMLDWLYPPRCPICHEIIMPKGYLVCPSCAERIQPIQEPRCKKCSKPIDNSAAEYCYDCLHTTHHFDQGMGIFPYSPLWQLSIMKFKYYGRKEYGKFYGTIMAFYGRSFLARWKPQVIIPVPIHKSRLKKRGYNQAFEIAKWVGYRCNIPVDPKLVKRKSHTVPQKELSRKQRRQNLKEAFSIPSEAVFYESVLIVDDIFTTGSTIDALAVLLKKHGVKRVYFLSLCVGGGF
ncbi:MAG: ComF family protein [Lachnospiraceae bacterium]